MLSRISKVNEIKLKAMTFASTFEIGDSQIINGLTRALAVQREEEIFFTSEGDFSKFPIFSEPIPLPPIVEDVVFQKMDINPCIHVSHIKITAVSSSSVIHLGNTNCVYMESRIKHIRQISEKTASLDQDSNI